MVLPGLFQAEEGPSRPLPELLWMEEAMRGHYVLLDNAGNEVSDRVEGRIDFVWAGDTLSIQMWPDHPDSDGSVTLHPTARAYAAVLRDEDGSPLDVQPVTVRETDAYRLTFPHMKPRVPDLDPRYEWVEIFRHDGSSIYAKSHCLHTEIADVHSVNGEVVAHLCLTCDTQLP